MQKRVWQGRALLVILWVFGSFGGFIAESARAGDYHEELVEQVRIAKEDPYYHAQFNPDDDIRLQTVLLLKPEEDEWLLIQKALYDSDKYVRRAAVSKLNSPKYVNLLWEIFWKDDSWYVREKALVNLVDTLDAAEKDLLQKEFIEIILDEEKCDLNAFGGLDKQNNQDFFVYLVNRDRDIVENGYMTNLRCFFVLLYINPKERIKLIEEIENHFANLSEENKIMLNRFYQDALEESSRKPTAE